MSVPSAPGQIASSSTSPMSEVESTLQRINQHPGVLGLIITQNDGKSSRVLSTTQDSPVITNKDAYAQSYTTLAAEARSAIRDLDPMVFSLTHTLTYRVISYLTSFFRMI